MSKVTKRISRRREYNIANKINGKRHTGSGALWWKKSDASNVDFQFEDKFTENKYFSIQLSILLKIEKEARAECKIPVLVIGFITKNKTYDFVVVRKKDCSAQHNSQFSIESKKKSYRVYLSTLRKYSNESSGKLLFQLSLAGNDYYVFTWEDFLIMQKGIGIRGLL